MKVIELINPEEIKQVEFLKNSIHCDKDFQCLLSDEDNLCTTMAFLTLDLLQCENEERASCFYSIPYGSLYFCKCEMRQLIEKCRK